MRVEFKFHYQNITMWLFQTENYIIEKVCVDTDTQLYTIINFRNEVGQNPNAKNF